MKKTSLREIRGGPTQKPHLPKTLKFRPYQLEAFQNRSNGIECWLWGRQTGKSFTLAAWAVDRLITRPGRLVTVLSNSLSNGSEFNLKCRELARLLSQAFEQNNQGNDLQFDCMNYETRIKVGNRISRIKILPANPRTARGFSGDLILDEFAFHENSTAIWEAAEPILSANPDFLCRIASTPNGKNNMFYQLVSDPTIPTRRVARSEAWLQGLQILHPVTRVPITPGEARALAHNKRSYDQNYECIFGDENSSWLSPSLIYQAQDRTVGSVCEDNWSAEIIAFLNSYTHDSVYADGPLTDPRGPRRDLYVGVDVGRTHDLTVITLVQKLPGLFKVRGVLRVRNRRLPEQQELLEIACRTPRFAAAAVDMTGLGLGLFEYTQQRFGGRIRGINFSSSIALPYRSQAKGIADRAKTPLVLAITLLQAFEAKQIKIPIDSALADDLCLPERIAYGQSETAISTNRTKNSHADHFWSLALAIHAAVDLPHSTVSVPEIRGGIKVRRNCYC